MRSLKFPIYVRPFGPLFVLVKQAEQYHRVLKLRKSLYHFFTISLPHIGANSNKDASTLVQEQRVV